MSPLTSTIIVTAPADAVWEIVAHQFDRIGDWATAIPSSTATTTPPMAGAAVPGRICRTGLRQAPEVTETVVAYDDTDRTLTYEATAGLPAFIATARNHWRITALDSHRTQVTFTAQVTVRGVLGRLAWWMLLLQVRYTGRHLLTDLKHYVETGTPPPRKQQQVRSSRRT